MRRFSRTCTLVLITSIAIWSSATPAGATVDGNTRKACLTATAISAGLTSATTVDTVDRQQLTAVAKRLKASTTNGARPLAARTRTAANHANGDKFVAAVDAVTRWCAGNGTTSTTTSTTTTTGPPTTTTTRPTLTPEATEFLFKQGATTPPYDELVKNPAGNGQTVFFRAKVFQYDTNTGLTSMLVYVTPGSYDFWNDVVLVNLPSAEAGNGIDNNDIVDIWGTPAGAYSYSTRIGGTNTVPKVAAKYVTLVSKG
jgi:hypothetical protein